MAYARRLAPLGLPLASVLFLIWGPIVGAAPDDEEYRNAIISVVLHARALLDGVYPYWTSSLAFGLPHPLHPALITHPLMPLFGMLAPDVAIRIVYAAHAVLGVVGAWRLVRHLAGGPWAAGLAACTWALSTPSQNYVLTDFWPAEFVIWSLAPWLLLGALRVIDAPIAGRRWIDAAAFGLVAGLMFANGHAGYVPVFFAPLALVFLVHWRQLDRFWPGLALAVCIGLAIAGPTLAHLITELGRFPPIGRLTAERVVGWEQLRDMVLRPVSLGSPSEMLATVQLRGARVPFFGGPLFLLALAGAAGMAGVFPYRRGLTAAFAVSFLLMLMPILERGGLFSGTFLFRDPMVLFGIVLGSLAWHSLAKRFPRAATAAAVLQVAVLFVAAWPFVNRAFGGLEITDPILHNTSTTAALRDWPQRVPGRWYIAPELDALVRSGLLYRDGLWLNVWLYSGLPIVNGTFKGVSTDDLYPSEYLPIGRIQGHPSTVASPSSLDVFGIGAVLATATEPVASTLQEVARVATRHNGDLRLLRNPEAWPGAAFVDEPALRQRLQPLPGCDVGGLLCLDLTAVAAAVHGSDVHVDRRHGDIGIRFRSDPLSSRWLVVSEMHRPGWRARAGSMDLPVSRVLNGLIAVRVPAGVDALELRYRPTLLVLLTWISGVTLLFTVSLLLVALTHPRRPASRYLYRMLARYVGYHVPPDARVVEFAPRSMLLVDLLRRPSTHVFFPTTAPGQSEAGVLSGWEAFKAAQPDRIILNGTLHYEHDIQATLEQLRAVCTPRTRIIVAYYSSLWRPLLTLGWHIGLSTKGPEHNWVTPSDVANLLRLTGYEIVNESQHLLMPLDIPLVSAFVNRWLAPLPVFRWFTLVNLALVRLAPSAWEPPPPSVSVVVPARNERGNIAGIVERIPPMGPADEIIFVEGHSSDGTWEAIQEVVARYPDRRIRALQQQGRGKGDAVRAGFAAATGELLMILDADLTVAPEDLPKFYGALTSGVGEFINGSRLIYPMEREAMRFANMVGNKFFALAFSYLLGQPLKDTLCGTKALSRRHYEEIARGRMYFGDFDPFGDFDLLFGAAKLGLRIVELPVRYGERTYGTTNIRRWVHGWLLLRMTTFAARKMKFI